MAKYNSPALDKGLDIIEYLSTQAISQSQTEIAIGIDKKPNEIYRMLVCLEVRGYIVKQQVSGKFRLSLKMLYLASTHEPIETLRIAALYPMQELSAFSKQSCHLSILDSQNVLVVAQNHSPGPISLSIKVGSNFPLVGSFSGSIFLSQLEKNNRLKILNKMPEFFKLSDKGKKEYLLHIDNIVKQRYYIMESTTTRGVVDIGVALYIPELNINAALCATVLSGQIQELLDSDFIIDKLNNAIKSIRTNLGLV